MKHKKHRKQKNNLKTNVPSPALCLRGSQQKTTSYSTFLGVGVLIRGSQGPRKTRDGWGKTGEEEGTYSFLSCSLSLLDFSSPGARSSWGKTLVRPLRFSVVFCLFVRFPLVFFGFYWFGLFFIGSPLVFFGFLPFCQISFGVLRFRLVLQPWALSWS